LSLTYIKKYLCDLILWCSFFPYRCQQCKDCNKVRCYHWCVGDEPSIEENLRLQLEEYVSACGTSYLEIKATSKIIYDPTDLNSTTNPYNIDYLPSGKLLFDI
jgi:hypothetical protein